MKSADGPQHLIIGGTIKAATSSLFNYLNAHPQICGSRIKETFFFSRDFSGDLEHDRKRYGAYFEPAPETRVLFEASPNYLAARVDVAPRIRQTIPDAKLLFVLRDPVERLYSHFNFARGKLDLPQHIDFETFVERCQSYSRGDGPRADSAIAEKYLRALEIGNYARYLEKFHSEFGHDRVLVLFYDDLKSNPLAALDRICAFVGVDPAFYRQYEMNRANVTFAARLAPLHRLALLFNRLLEPVLRHRPALKFRLVSLYKRLNRDPQHIEPMRPEIRSRLRDYYRPANAALARMFSDRRLPAWVDPGEEAES